MRFVFLLTFIYTVSFISLLIELWTCTVFKTYAAILKSSMNNNYPQVAVLGCDSDKANLYYDVQRQVWVEHLISPCVNNEQSILEFCQQVKFSSYDQLELYIPFLRLIHHLILVISFDLRLYYVLRIGVNCFRQLIIRFRVARMVINLRKSCNHFVVYMLILNAKKQPILLSIVQLIVLIKLVNAYALNYGSNMHHLTVWRN